MQCLQKENGSVEDQCNWATTILSLFIMNGLHLYLVLRQLEISAHLTKLAMSEYVPPKQLGVKGSVLGGEIVLKAYALCCSNLTLLLWGNWVIFISLPFHTAFRVQFLGLKA